MNFNKIILIVFALQTITIFAEETSGSVVYFQRHEIGVKIKKFDPPVQVEWYQIDASAPTRLTEQIQIMQTESFFAHDNFESWYEALNASCTESYFEAFSSKVDQLTDSFKRNHTSLDEFKKKYPQLRYSSVIYTIEYTLSTNEYVDVVYVSGAEALKAYPNNLVELKEAHRLGAKFLKNENGVWKSEIKPTYLQQLTKLWDDLPHLRSLLDTHTYHSRESRGLKAFDPSDELKLDSSRDHYANETFFQYHNPTQRAAFVAAQTPYAPSPATAPPLENSHEPAEVQPSAWLIGLLVAYGLVATIGWMRK